MSETRATPRHQEDPWEEIRGVEGYTIEEIQRWQSSRLQTMRDLPHAWSASEKSFACQIDFLLRELAAVDARHAEEIAAKDRRERDLENALVRQEHLKDLAEAENTTLREQLAAYKAENAEVRRIAGQERTELAAVADAAEAKLAAVQQELAKFKLTHEKHALHLSVGDMVTLGDRRVQVCGDHRGIFKDHRGRVAVRNYETNRLSYVPPERLIAALSSPSTQEPQTVCEWKRASPSFEWTWMSGCGFEFVAGFSCTPPEDEMNWCPYCGKPLQLSPESPNEGAK